MRPAYQLEIDDRKTIGFEDFNTLINWAKAVYGGGIPPYDKL